MDTITLVEAQIEDGRRFIKRLVDDGFDVTAAAWLKSVETDGQFLYVASTTVDDAGLISAYKQVHSAWAKLWEPCVQWFEVKLLSAKSPIAADILEIQRKYPAPLATHLQRAQLGSLLIESAFIYPPLSPGTDADRLSPSEAAERVLDLIQQTTGASTTVTLHDGSSFHGIPVGVERDAANGVTLKFIDDDTQLPRLLPAAEVTAIQ